MAAPSQIDDVACTPGISIVVQVVRQYVVATWIVQPLLAVVVRKWKHERTLLRSYNVTSPVEQESFFVCNNGYQLLPRSPFVRADVDRVLIDA